MNDNDFHREDENTTEEPRVSSVEYGPYDHNAYYGQTKKNKGTVAILIACAVILLVAIFAAAGALLFGGSGENSGGTGNSGDLTGGAGSAARPEYSGNVVIYVTDENAVIKDGSVASVVQKCDASVVEIMTKSVSPGNNSTGGAGSGVIIGVDKENQYTYIILLSSG